MEAPKPLQEVLEVETDEETTQRLLGAYGVFDALTGEIPISPIHESDDKWVQRSNN